MSKIRSFFLIASLLIFSFGAKAQTQAILTIYSYTRNNESTQGSGFILGSNGIAITAYHVVENAREIEAVDQTSQIHKLKVLWIDTQRDVAVLAAETLRGIQGLSLALATPNSPTEIRVFGSPRGLPKQILYGKTTASTGTVNSLGISSSTGRPVFAEKIQVIPLDITVYGGLSGAPVVDGNGNAIALLSGSYDEGRGIAWGIPASYIREAISKGTTAQEPRSVSWPPLTLMSGNWLSLKRSYNKKFDSDHMQRLETMAGLYSRLSGGEWRASDTKVDNLIYDDSTIGRCVRRVTSSANATFVAFDADKALLTGRLNSSTIIQALFTPGSSYSSDNEHTRKMCYKEVVGSVESSSSPSVDTDMEVTVLTGEDDPAKIVIQLNVESCLIGGSDCATNAFGSKRGGRIEFVNSGLIKWQGLVFRRQ